MFKLLTAAGTEAVSLEKAKARLRIESTAFDAELQSLLAAASITVEAATGLTLQPSTWRYAQECWPCGREPLDIPSKPVRDVTAVTYLDASNVEQTLDSDAWSWLRTDAGAEIRFASSFTFPALYDAPDAVRVVVSAGFDDPDTSGSGDDPELTLDPRVEMAILFLVAHWFEHRESVMALPSIQPYPVPDTFWLMVMQLKVYR